MEQCLNLLSPQVRMCIVSQTQYTGHHLFMLGYSMHVLYSYVRYTYVPEKVKAAQ